MSRREFMEELKKLLSGISDEERDEALKYYEDYFEEAGSGNEEQVIQELGSPQKVAAMIKADLEEGSEKSGEFTEWGYTDERFEEKETPATKEQADSETEDKTGAREESHSRGYSYGGSENSRGYSYGGNETGKGYTHKGNGTDVSGSGEKAPWTSRTLKIVLTMLIIIAAFPGLLPVLISILAVVAVLILAAASSFAVLAIASAALALAGICVTVIGSVSLIADFPTAMMTMGIGILLFVIGIILTAASVKLCLVMYPAMYRAVVNICRRIVHRKKRTA
ncbi:MAG: DUF1700 domain-containing protein [Schaedlerella sp.]|nr:DUF1700 domain-containing protein [Lachnospiraceae bacterium]MDY4203464.1 DUF1700 domain-containing protein [Schaedlerella sp.]